MLNVSLGVLSIPVVLHLSTVYIPQSMLSDILRSQVFPGTLSGRKEDISVMLAKEGELVAFITNAAEIGYGYTVKEILFLVQEVIE